MGGQPLRTSGTCEKCGAEYRVAVESGLGYVVSDDDDA